MLDYPLGYNTSADSSRLRPQTLPQNPPIFSSTHTDQPTILHSFFTPANTHFYLLNLYDVFIHMQINTLFTHTHTD